MLLNERRATPPGRILSAAWRDGAIFPQFCVAKPIHGLGPSGQPTAVQNGSGQFCIAHLYSITTRRLRRLVLRKNGLRRGVVLVVNRP